MARSITYKIGQGSLSKFVAEAQTPSEIVTKEGLNPSHYTCVIRSEGAATGRPADMNDTLTDNDTVHFASNKSGA